MSFTLTKALNVSLPLCFDQFRKFLGIARIAQDIF